MVESRSCWNVKNRIFFYRKLGADVGQQQCDIKKEHLITNTSLIHDCEFTGV